MLSAEPPLHNFAVATSTVSSSALKIRPGTQSNYVRTFNLTAFEAPCGHEDAEATPQHRQTKLPYVSAESCIVLTEHSKPHAQQSYSLPSAARSWPRALGAEVEHTVDVAYLLVSPPSAST
jgi:hypothetical protein